MRQLVSKFQTFESHIYSFLLIFQIEKFSQSNEESMSLSNETTLTVLEDEVAELEEKIKTLQHKN